MMPATLGHYVYTLFDTGARGLQTLYGRIVKAGEKTVTIEWESGIRNRLRLPHREIKFCQSDEDKVAARDAMRRVTK